MESAINTEGSVSFDRQAFLTTLIGQRMVDQIYNLPSSRDIDPEIGVVLQWHIDLCPECDTSGKPVGFGQHIRRCSEFTEIIMEYGEYEVQYAWKGNV